ncbi:MAG: monovalent cation/H+ antiporter subunit D family protein [Candidatus Aminicenantes bacterium]|nr:monovalent cation/H+ antiporter subunit D family protein [Candidatus Aminicenantes bacterium]NIM83837.1 monovalent cation/H+ antiporter subunit D family protein [Candidatus Aminicenantes bacterium]NIN23301.1 monovalent cation/H+ antiporter subunit D family protein [Candidatus Aminicenantes bacterium]NIN47005.1 monovalent cation/H+ antiporter subunit D family protein [Candidatus Aminicenantes bacterium]NIN89927.1 monovalent cation/H+ antiporter subunit D family protein [Candidatus Aminicenant
MTTPETYASFIPLWAVLVSLIAVPLILLSSKYRNLREFWTIAASFIKFGLVLSLLPGALANKTAEISIVEIFPGIAMTLRADPFGVFFALIASGLWIFTSFYSIGYVRGVPEHKQTRYFASFAVCLSATMGIAFSANLLTFIIFYEILTIATYPLVIHKETKEAIYGGRKYLIYTLTAGLFLIAASAWTYQLTGTLDFRAGGLFGEGILTPQTAVVLFFLFLGGVGVKAAIMPLHSWLPTAMVAPTPVSALLHAVAVVKSGVFAVIRVVGFVFGPVIMREFGLNTILLVLAGFTIIVASLIAICQDNLKRRLAFSTVGHLSYIVLGAALITPAGFTGGMMHIAFHATMKITLFFVAGAIYVNLHRENISQLDGIGKVMPWTMGAFTVGAIGLAGIPPINGFVSKWYLGMGSIESGSLVPLGILVLSGLLNAAYFFPIVHVAFFKKGKNLEGKGEAPMFMVVPIVITAILSLLLGIYPDLFLKFYTLAGKIAASIMGGG